MMVGKPAFGIDFGTTNSVVVAAAGDRVTALMDAEPHPSIVWYGPEAIVVGEQAKESFHAYNDSPGHRFVGSIKRQLGRSREIDVAGHRIPAHMVATEIFRHLRSDAKDRGYDLNEAVVTVPVDFDGQQRADIRRAARQAGIEVSALIHEPFAAAVGYYNGLDEELVALPDETILVFDWGGGTLDTTIVRSRDGKLEEIATGGLPDVAGDLFDEHVRSFAVARFMAMNGLSPDAFNPMRATEDRLARESERAKIELSTRRAATINVAAITQVDGVDIDLKEPIQRSEFEDIIRGRVQQAVGVVHQMLKDARLSAEDIDRALLIGGTSLIPLVRQELERIFDVRTQTPPNGQTIIAEGAAIVAQRGFAPFLAAPVEVVLANELLYTVFPRETGVPVIEGKDVSMFCTDNRDGEARLIVRSEGQADERGRYERVLNVPVVRTLPTPEHHEDVSAHFKINEDLVLEVEAYGTARGEVARLALHDLRFGLRLR